MVRQRKNGLEPLMLSPEKMAEALDATQWATKFEWEEILAIAQVMRAFEVKQGVVLWEEGETDRYMGIIRKGRVVVIKSDKKKREDSEIATLGRGQSLGEMSIVDREPRSATVKVTEDLTLLMLTASDLEKLRDENPLVAYKLVWQLAQLLSQRLRKTSGQLIDFLCIAEKV